VVARFPNFRTCQAYGMELATVYISSLVRN
jgi:hypothetical protein